MQLAYYADGQSAVSNLWFYFLLLSGGSPHFAHDYISLSLKILIYKWPNLMSSAQYYLD